MDHLTEIYNRRYLEAQLEDEVRQVQRSGIRSAIVYLDLDRFKYVNDTIGHDAGDQLLIDIGRTLTKKLRRNDLVARIGGDEFAIILKNVDEALAVNLADSCREALAALRVQRGDKNYHVQASVGVAMMGAESPTAGDVLADADVACHIAKRLGRNQTYLYEKTDDDRSVMGSELGWSERIRDALKNNGFVLHFQPSLDMSAVELANLPAQGWFVMAAASENKKKITMPMKCFCVCSQNLTSCISRIRSYLSQNDLNMMTEIDLWVVENSLKAMIATGSPKGKLNLSINLSGNTLDSDESAKQIKSLIEKYNVSPESLIFEITETSAIANMDQAKQFITGLNEIGCRFSLDDFGSGFCSFSQLKNLPTDFVKIDGQFVKSMARGSTDRAIVTAMNDVAHSLSRSTVAEFVESPEVMRLLKICGVDRVQGNYISKPLEQLPHGNVVKLHTQQSKNRLE